MRLIKLDCRVPFSGGPYQAGAERERGREKLLLVLVVCGERKAEERTERRRVSRRGIRALTICLNLKKKKKELVYSHGYAGPESIQAGHASLARLNGSL